MEVKVFGEKLLMMNNYDSITIESPLEKQMWVRKDAYGCFLASGFSTEISEDKINVTIENSKQEEIVSLLSCDINNDIQSNWKFLNNLSDVDKIEEVVSYFLTKNRIRGIYYKRSTKYERHYDYNLEVYSLEDKKLIIKISGELANRFGTIMKKINTKYKEDLLQLLVYNRNENYYYFAIPERFEPNYSIDSLQNTFLRWYLKDVDLEQKTIIINDYLNNCLKYFEERLNLEKEEVSLELYENGNIILFIIKSKDSIFGFQILGYSVEETKKSIENIIEKHNQSIEKGKKLLKNLEKGNRELWLEWE